MVKPVNQYLTKGLKIMTNKLNSVRVAHKAILLLLYAWNSCPIPGTNIRSLVAVGHKFASPINYLTNKHWELTSSPNSVKSYSRDLATHLAALREVAHLLVKEHWAYHHDLINSWQLDPHTNSVGDIVFACHEVQSDAAKGREDKLQFAFTGPWKVTVALKGV